MAGGTEIYYILVTFDKRNVGSDLLPSGTQNVKYRYHKKITKGSQKMITIPTYKIYL